MTILLTALVVFGHFANVRRRFIKWTEGKNDDCHWTDTLNSWWSRFIEMNDSKVSTITLSRSLWTHKNAMNSNVQRFPFLMTFVRICQFHLKWFWADFNQDSPYMNAWEWMWWSNYVLKWNWQSLLIKKFSLNWSEDKKHSFTTWIDCRFRATTNLKF